MKVGGGKKTFMLGSTWFPQLPGMNSWFNTNVAPDEEKQPLQSDPMSPAAEVRRVKQYGTRDPYAILGLTPDATEEEISRAHRDMARRLHPDKNPDSGAAEAFHVLREAYQTLKDPKLREAHDATREGSKIGVDPDGPVEDIVVNLDGIDPVSLMTTGDIGAKMVADIGGGCFVYKVVPESPAAKAGLEPGMIIHAVNEEWVNTKDKVVEQLIVEARKWYNAYPQFGGTVARHPAPGQEYVYCVDGDVYESGDAGADKIGKLTKGTRIHLLDICSGEKEWLLGRIDQPVAGYVQILNKGTGVMPMHSAADGPLELVLTTHYDAELAHGLWTQRQGIFNMSMQIVRKELSTGNPKAIAGLMRAGVPRYHPDLKGWESPRYSEIGARWRPPDARFMITGQKGLPVEADEAAANEGTSTMNGDTVANSSHVNERSTQANKAAASRQQARSRKLAAVRVSIG